MAASEYLKTAAAHLHRAADFLQRQASDLLSERQRATHQKGNELTRHQFHLKTKQMEAAQAQDSEAKAHLEQQAKELSRQVDNKKSEIKQVDQQLNNAAHVKQAAAQRLADQARTLESQASSPELSS